jgi:mediator of RNA polymerase II transcription subunit 12
LDYILSCVNNHPDLPNDWQDLSSLLSPCKLGATAVVMQFVLRQMGRRLSQELTHQAASASLDEMTLKIFHHSMTPEEAYSVAEMVKGVDSAVAGKVSIDLRCFHCMLSDRITLVHQQWSEMHRRDH